MKSYRVLSEKLKTKIRTVSFDAGGTIYYEENEGHVIYRVALNELGFDVNNVVVKEALKKAREWNREKAEANVVWNDDVWIRMLKRFLSNLMLPDLKELATKLRSLWQEKLILHAYQDVEPTFKKLQQMQIKIIVISNVSSKKNLQVYLDKVRLTSYFDALVASGSIGYEKPNPEIFKAASKLSGTPPSHIMHIGDKYKEDYIGAQNAGMKAVLIDRKGEQKDKKCLKIHELTELFTYL